MRYTIEVTQEDILSGRRGHICLCPIAISIKRVFPTHQINVRADYLEIQVDGRETVEAPLPMSVVRFIEIFDDIGSYHVRPFTFNLSLLEKING